MAENKTIKQIADEIGVSKTAVRNYMDDEFRAKFTTKDNKGVITITPEGCKVLSENIGKQSENTAKQIPETELLTIPRSVLTMLERQIEHLQAELATERSHSRELSDRLATLADQEQRLHANTMKQLPAAEAAASAPKKKWFWNKKEG